MTSFPAFFRDDDDVIQYDLTTIAATELKRHPIIHYIVPLIAWYQYNKH